MPASIMLEALGQLAVLFLLEGGAGEPGKVVSPQTIFFTSCEGVRCHRMCKPGDVLSLSIKPKRLKAPLATFEGAIRVGQEKAAIAEEITLTFGYRRGSGGRDGRAEAAPPTVSRRRCPPWSTPERGSSSPTGRARLAPMCRRPTEMGPMPHGLSLRAIRLARGRWQPGAVRASHRMRKVYITGIGLVTSIGNDVAAVSQNLRELRHGFEVYPPFQKADVPVKVIGTIKGYDTDSFDREDWAYPPSRFRSNGIFCAAWRRKFLYSLLCDASGCCRCEAGGPRTSPILTPGFTPPREALRFLPHSIMHRCSSWACMRCSPLGIVASIAGTLNFNLVAHFKIRARRAASRRPARPPRTRSVSRTTRSCCGRQKRMFVVGAEDCNTDSILPFAGMRALSLQTNPDLASRPFDASRDGFVGTGGGAVLVIEGEEEVERRGVRTYCEIAGWGQASDGYNVAISHPEGSGLRVAMTNAIRQAGVEPAAVDYVNAHATSTPIGDTSEAKALKAVFKDAGMRPAISSTKALTGHGLSVAGAMETAFCAIALKEGFIPGSAHITKLDPECEGLNIIRATLSQQPHIVLNNSSGFGGANVCIVLRQA